MSREFFTYSNLFSTIYDEQEPVGLLGRGTHYSILSCPIPIIEDEKYHLHKHDFAIIWDEDHDKRIIPVLEKIYTLGLMDSILVIGERKAGLTIIVNNQVNAKSEISNSISEIEALVETLIGDFWNVEIYSLKEILSNSNISGMLINDTHSKIKTYIENIFNLWGLGSNDYDITSFKYRLSTVNQETHKKSVEDDTSTKKPSGKKFNFSSSTKKPSKISFGTNK